MGPVCRTLTSTVLITIGAAFFSLGLVVKFSLFPAILEAQVYENLKIEEGTEGYDAFVEPPVPVYMKFRWVLQGRRKLGSSDPPLVQKEKQT